MTEAADVSERNVGKVRDSTAMVVAHMCILQAGSWMQVRIPVAEHMDFVKRPKTSNDVQIKDLQQTKTKKEEEKTRVEKMIDKVLYSLRLQLDYLAWCVAVGPHIFGSLCTCLPTFSYLLFIFFLGEKGQG